MGFNRIGMLAKQSRTLAAQTAFLTLATTSLAHAVVQVPASVDPSQVEKNVSQPSQNAPLPQSRVVTPEPQTPRISRDLAAQVEQKRIVVKDVTVEGSTVYTSQSLKSAYADLIGKEATPAGLQAVAQNITNKYHNDGYILSQAIIPNQGFEGGVVKIRVIEGYISNVRVEGDVRENSWRKPVEAYAEAIKRQRPIRVADLERYMLLMNDLPGASAKGVVAPSATPGTADLIVTFTHKTFEGSYTLDNRGTRYVGPWQHSFTLGANSVLGMYDRTLLRFVTTSPVSNLQFYDLQHEEQISNEGTRLILDASHSRTAPGDALKPLGIIGNSNFFMGRVTHPFIRSRQENLTGRFTFDTRNTDTAVFKTVNLSQDRLRVVRAGGNYDFVDGLYGVNLIDSQVSHGLNILGATSSGSNRTNSNGDSSFTKLNLDLSRTQPLPYDFSIFASASGQYSFQPLLVSEQFTLGGIGFGQAYDPAELSGDSGIAGRVELRYGRYLGDPYLNSFQVYSYYDGGRVWLHSPFAGVNDKKSLVSWGLGLRTNFSEYLSSNLEFAIPVTKPLASAPTHGNAGRFFYSMTARF